MNRNRTIKVATPLATLLATLLAAAALTGCGGNTEPTKTVTVTAPPPAPQTVTPAPKIVTKTIVREVVPTSCLSALKYSDQGFGYAAAALTAAQHGFQAIQNFDLDAVDAATQEMSDVTDKVRVLAPKYQAARDECRSLAK